MLTHCTLIMLSIPAAALNYCPSPSACNTGCQLECSQPETALSSTTGLPDMLALVVSRVHPTQGQLPSLPPLNISVQPEAEYRVLHKSLVDHVVEGGHSARHCYLRKT